MARVETTYKMNIDSGNAVKDIKEIDKNMSALADTINTEVTSSISTMEDKLYDMALAGDTTSKEFKELQAQTAKYKKVIIETDRSIDALAEQGRGLSTALSIGESTVAGFQAFTGITALMGTENEELLATITKLQAAQGVLNSIEILKQQVQKNSIKITQAQNFITQAFTKTTQDGTKALKGWKVALAATGIGAIIIGITLLVQNWDKLKRAIGLTTEAQVKSNEASKKAVESIADELSASDKLSKVLKDEKVSREDKVKAVKELQAEYPSLLSNVDAENDSLEDINKALDLNTKLTRLNAKAKAVAELRSEAYKTQLEAEIDAQTGANEGIINSLQAWGLNTDAKELAVQKSKSVQNEQQNEINLLDEIDKSIKKETESLKEQGAVVEDINKKKQDQDTKAKAYHDAQLKRQQDELKAQQDAVAFRESILDLIAQTEEAHLTSAKQRELNAVNEKYFELITRAEEFGQNTAILKEAQEQQLLDIENKFKGEKFAQDKALEEKRRALVQETEKLKIDLMIEGYAKEQEQLVLDYEAKRLLVAENELLSAQEKVLILSDLKEQEEAALDAIKVKWREKELADDKKAAADKKQIRDDNFQHVQNGLQSLSDLNSLVTDIQLANAKGNAQKEEAIQRKSFERNKKIQIAMATINTIQGVINALTAQSVIPEPFGTILKAGNAVAVGIAGAANIAKIARSTYQGGGASSPSIPSPSGSGAGASASAFSVADTSSQQTNLNADGSQADSGTPIPKVYVSVTEIKEKADGVEAIEQYSKY
jgi:hypothetical protein